MDDVGRRGGDRITDPVHGAACPVVVALPWTPSVSEAESAVWLQPMGLHVPLQWPFHGSSSLKKTAMEGGVEDDDHGVVCRGCFRCRWALGRNDVGGGGVVEP
jgi:hypothetical protein